MSDRQHRLVGDWPDLEVANDFLDHLRIRGFSPATRRVYAFDLLNFGRFLQGHELALVALTAMDVFGWIDWQSQPAPSTGKVVRLRPRTVAPSTVNRRVAAVRGLFEFLLMRQAITASPVPAPRRSSGLRPIPRGLLGHLAEGRRRSGGRLVRQDNLLPESLPPADVDVFLSDLRTHRDRAIVLLMLLGGLRSAEVRGLLLRDVDMGRRRLRVVGKGGKERVVPVDGVFFAELGAYLRRERPSGLATPECFMVLRGPTAGGPLSEAGLRSLFRRHRDSSGQLRVRPHRLRHTYGTELAAAGIDLLVLRELMGHASPETTARQSMPTPRSRKKRSPGPRRSASSPADTDPPMRSSPSLKDSDYVERVTAEPVSRQGESQPPTTGST